MRNVLNLKAADPMLAPGHLDRFANVNNGRKLTSRLFQCVRFAAQVLGKGISAEVVQNLGDPIST